MLADNALMEIKSNNVIKQEESTIEREYFSKIIYFAFNTVVKHMPKTDIVINLDIPKIVLYIYLIIFPIFNLTRFKDINNSLELVS